MQWHCCINEDATAGGAAATSFLLGSIRWGTPEWNPFQVSLCHISHFCWLSWDRLPWNEICWDVFRARFWSQKGMQWCEAPSPTFLLSLLLPLSPSPRAQHWRYFPIGKLSTGSVVVWRRVEQLMRTDFQVLLMHSGILIDPLEVALWCSLLLQSY